MNMQLGRKRYALLAQRRIVKICACQECDFEKTKQGCGLA